MTPRHRRFTQQTTIRLGGSTDKVEKGFMHVDAVIHNGFSKILKSILLEEIFMENDLKRSDKYPNELETPQAYESCLCKLNMAVTFMIVCHCVRCL